MKILAAFKYRSQVLNPDNGNSQRVTETCRSISAQLMSAKFSRSVGKGLLGKAVQLFGSESVAH